MPLTPRDGRAGRAAAVILVALATFIVAGGLVGWLVERIQDRRAGRQPFVVSVADSSPAGAVSRAAARVGPAVVRIDGAPRPPPRQRGDRSPALPGTGSGVIINPPKGYVLTNSHVIRDAQHPRVTLADGRTFSSRVLGRDPVTDLAVLRIPPENLPWAPLGSSRDLPIGAWVLVIGNPYGFQNSVSVGVVSAKQRNVGGMLEDLIQTDAAINEGNSGGALVNLSGEVVGIPTTSFPYAQGIGFATAIDRAKEIVPQLIAHGKVIRPWIGIRYLEINDDVLARETLPLRSGLLVKQVLEGTPAQRAGLRAGDIITQASGHPATAADDLRLELRRRAPGDRLPLAVHRDGKTLALTVILGEMPSDLSLEPEQP